MKWVVISLVLMDLIPCTSFSPLGAARRRVGESLLLSSVHDTLSIETSLLVAEVECRPVYVSALNLTVLEATANAQDVLVNSVLEEESGLLPSGDPYGMVVWPAAAALGRHLSERDLSGRCVWEVGSGTGVVSIAAAQQGALSVYATDYESLTLKLLEYAAYEMNDISPSVLSTGLWDITRDTELLPLPHADLLVAADVLYEPRTGVALAKLVVRALHAGMEVMLADSPGRAGRPAFLEHLNPCLIQPVTGFVSIKGTTITDERHDLICGKGSTTISDTPKPLPIALLELHPAMVRRGSS